jgi:hypothetical protein
MLGAEDGNSTTPTTDIPIAPTDATVVVPKATMLGTGLDLASPQYAEKARPAAPLAGVYTPSELAPPPMPAASDSAALLQAIMAHLDKKIDPLTRRLATLEEVQDLNPRLNEGGYNYLWGGLEYDHHSKDNTPEQNKLLREIAEKQGQYHYDANN